MISELLLLPNGDAVEAHNNADARVWGLFEVSLGLRPPYPVTIYKVSGDSASGVMGLLQPDGTFLKKAESQMGRTVTVVQPPDEPVTLEVRWDGAAPCLTFEDDEGTVRSEHSKGLLLGDYATERLVVRPTLTTTDGYRHRITEPGRRSGWVSSQGSLTYVDPPSLRRAA